MAKITVGELQARMLEPKKSEPAGYVPPAGLTSPLYDNREIAQITMAHIYNRVCAKSGGIRLNVGNLATITNTTVRELIASLSKNDIDRYNTPEHHNPDGTLKPIYEYHPASDNGWTPIIKYWADRQTGALVAHPRPGVQDIEERYLPVRDLFRRDCEMTPRLRALAKGLFKANVEILPYLQDSSGRMKLDYMHYLMAYTSLSNRDSFSRSRKNAVVYRDLVAMGHKPGAQAMYMRYNAKPVTSVTLETLKTAVVFSGLNFFFDETVNLLKYFQLVKEGNNRGRAKTEARIYPQFRSDRKNGLTFWTVPVANPQPRILDMNIMAFLAMPEPSNVLPNANKGSCYFISARKCFYDVYYDKIVSCFTREYDKATAVKEGHSTFINYAPTQLELTFARQIFDGEFYNTTSFFNNILNAYRQRDNHKELDGRAGPTPMFENPYYEQIMPAVERYLTDCVREFLTIAAQNNLGFKDAHIYYANTTMVAFYISQEVKKSRVFDMFFTKTSALRPQALNYSSLLTPYAYL